MSHYFLSNIYNGNSNYCVNKTRTIFVPGEPVKEATPSADTLWNVLKREEERKMQPVAEYSEYMRVKFNVSHTHGLSYILICRIFN